MQRQVWRSKHLFPKHSPGYCDSGEKPQHCQCLWNTTGVSSRTNLPIAWVVPRESNHARLCLLIILSFNIMGSLKKGLAFLVNLPHVH